MSSLLGVDGQGNPDFGPLSGTSMAAPHGTGTVALLQQYANTQGWGNTARRHEVMKVVLMNSADKITGTGVDQARRLCMQKDILNKPGSGGSGWLTSDAFGPFTQHPVDDEMGTGQLNTKRALKQFSSGQQIFTQSNVPLIGWDFQTVYPLNYRKYVLAKRLEASSYISITVAWDRDVRLNDANSNGMYDVGETFTDFGLPNLDLYLMPKGATSKTQAIANSVTTIYSLEHIFTQIQNAAEYEIWVYGEDVPSAGWDYAIAWWAVADPGDCPADINGDDTVDVQDMNAVLNNYGPDRCGHPADVVRDGTINAQDLLFVINNWGICYGACCFPNGSCQSNVPPADCQNDGGIAMAHGSTCSPNPCETFQNPPPSGTGACCIGWNCIPNVSPNSCTNAGGTPASRPCLPNPCFPPSTDTGACCLPDGSCAGGMTKAQCSQQSGWWRGPNTTCQTPCNSQTETPKPCCLAGGLCKMIPQTLCQSLGGVPSGGQACTSLSCICCPNTNPPTCKTSYTCVVPGLSYNRRDGCSISIGSVQVVMQQSNNWWSGQAQASVSGSCTNQGFSVPDSATVHASLTCLGPDGWGILIHVQTNCSTQNCCCCVSNYWLIKQTPSATPIGTYDMVDEGPRVAYCQHCGHMPSATVSD